MKRPHLHPAPFRHDDQLAGVISHAWNPTVVSLRLGGEGARFATVFRRPQCVRSFPEPIPRQPACIDSAGAAGAPTLYGEFGNGKNPGIGFSAGSGDRRRRRCHEAHFVKPAEKSRRPSTRHTPTGIISAGGKRACLPLKGALEIKLHWQLIPAKVETGSVFGLPARGGHSGAGRWSSIFQCAPRQASIVHREDDGRAGLQNESAAKSGWLAHIRECFEAVEFQDG